MAVRGCSVVAIEALEEDQATSESMTQSHMVTSQFLGQTDALGQKFNATNKTLVQL
jgi:hypothetical protein